MELALITWIPIPRSRIKGTTAAATSFLDLAINTNFFSIQKLYGIATTAQMTCKPFFVSVPASGMIG
jgi:hypothetical protein